MGEVGSLALQGNPDGQKVNHAKFVVRHGAGEKSGETHEAWLCAWRFCPSLGNPKGIKENTWTQHLAGTSSKKEHGPTENVLHLLPSQQWPSAGMTRPAGLWDIIQSAIEKRKQKF